VPPVAAERTTGVGVDGRREDSIPAFDAPSALELITAAMRKSDIVALDAPPNLLAFQPPNAASPVR
jgi:hypothetical protein